MIKNNFFGITLILFDMGVMFFNAYQMIHVI